MRCEVLRQTVRQVNQPAREPGLLQRECGLGLRQAHRVSRSNPFRRGFQVGAQFDISPAASARLQNCWPRLGLR